MADSAYTRLVASLTDEQRAWLDEAEQAIRRDERELAHREEYGVEDDPIGWLPPQVKGEVGVIEGPPIAGTTDRVNSGVARRGALVGEVIEPIDQTEGMVAWPRWRPAGEVGEITGAGASIVEDPRNDARPIDPPAPALVDGFVIPTGWTPGRLGLCRSCAAPIMWATTPGGRPSPINADGVSHFATCPQADQWRRR